MVLWFVSKKSRAASCLQSALRAGVHVTDFHPAKSRVCPLFDATMALFARCRDAYRSRAL